MYDNEDKELDGPAIEVRLAYYSGLVCPNPAEYYKNTRSYADMRTEYELLHSYEINLIEFNKLLRPMPWYKKLWRKICLNG